LKVITDRAGANCVGSGKNFPSRQAGWEYQPPTSAV